MLALPQNVLAATVLFSVNELVNTVRDDGVFLAASLCPLISDHHTTGGCILGSA